MSATDAANTTRSLPRVRPKTEPQPLRTPEDAEGWRVVTRGRGKGKMPRIGVEVHFDDAQSAWLRTDAEPRGLTYTELVKRLVDEARAGSGA